MQTNLLGILLIFSYLLSSCSNDPQPTANKTPLPVENKTVDAVNFQNKGHELIYQMVQKTGTYNKFFDKKNVTYTYTYQTPDGKTDVSTEKYLFDGELSYGMYKQHERTFPQLEGVIEQGFDGKEFWLKQGDKILSDPELLKMVAFKRPTNYYWFMMLPKLLDPSVNYEHLGEKVINDTNYDIVKVSFQSENDKPTDIYQLYINKKTSLVDQFLFTVADFGKMETPLLMQVEYEEVEGLLIPTKRKYKQSTWEAVETDAPWIEVTWSDIKFNTPITQTDFKK
jgi:hypothetical protein